MEKKNINLVPTSLNGNKIRDICADFTLNDNGSRLLKCPNNVFPKSSKYDKKREIINAKFDPKICEACPYNDKCKPTINKKALSLFLWVNGR